MMAARRSGVIRERTAAVGAAVPARGRDYCQTAAATPRRRRARRAIRARRAAETGRSRHVSPQSLYRPVEYYSIRLGSPMSPDRLKALFAIYRGGLIDDTLPFWIRHAIDRTHGGYMTALDRDGSVLQTDKPIWVHGRFAWLLATLYDTVDRREEWLALSKHGIDFLNRHAFDTDGRMFFRSRARAGRCASAGTCSRKRSR